MFFFFVLGTLDLEFVHHYLGKIGSFRMEIFSENYLLKAHQKKAPPHTYSPLCPPAQLGTEGGSTPRTPSNHTPPSKETTSLTSNTLASFALVLNCRSDGNLVSGFFLSVVSVWFIHIAVCSCSSPALCCVVFHCYEYFTINWELMDIWVVFKFWLRPTVLLCTPLYTSFLEYMYAFLLHTYWRVGLCGYNVCVH